MTAMFGMEPLRESVEERPTGDEIEAGFARFARETEPLEAAVMLAWREVSSCIMRSFWSCLSAWTVCACWRRLSRRENCFEQWHVNGRSPVCFLLGMTALVSVGRGDEKTEKGEEAGGGV